MLHVWGVFSELLVYYSKFCANNGERILMVIYQRIGNTDKNYQRKKNKCCNDKYLKKRTRKKSKPMNCILSIELIRNLFEKCLGVPDQIGIKGGKYGFEQGREPTANSTYINRNLKIRRRRRYEVVKKAIGLITKTTILHVLLAFLYISWPSLHDYDIEKKTTTTT